MNIVFTVLILLLAVAASGLLLEILPFKLPRPLVQVVLGACLAWPSSGLHVAIDPDLFFLLFLPPLLFIDAWRMPRREFRRLLAPIAILAFGLVIVTVICVGYFVHWMIPALPLAACFALGAVLSPTDAVSVSSITGSSPIPARLLHVLRGESLLNDASGLVALRFSAAAAVSGEFSITSASLSFVVIAIGGLAIGWALAWLFVKARSFLNYRQVSDPTNHVALLMLLPFAAYLLGENLGVSGILSAVAAGLTLNSMDTLKSELSARMQLSTLWTMLEFVLNGMVFLLLGLQLPWILMHASEALGSIGLASDWWHLIVYPSAVLLLLLVTRFIWSWPLLWWTRHRGSRAEQVVSTVNLRIVAATMLAGVRGTVTLAAVLSLPLLQADGSAFPGRELLIYIAAGVILLSLLLASVGLPPLLRRIDLSEEDPTLQEETDARKLAAQAAIRTLEELRDQTKNKKNDPDQAKLYEKIAGQLIDTYRP